MVRLIDADALIKDLEYDVELDARALDDTDLLLGRNRELVQFDKDCKQNAIDMLKKAPTVDAVPVIRCKDCKFSMSGIDKYNERYILCQLHERSYGVIDDGFCMWAERKEE